MRRILLTISFVILVGMLGFVGYLGYFNDPEMKVTTSPSYSMIGKYYFGGLEEKSLGKLFQDADSLILKEGIQGKTAIILDKNPMKAKDTLKAFVGVLLNDSTSELPSGYKFRNVPSRKVLHTEITGSFLTLPINVYEKVTKYAKENALHISTDGAIEIYESDKKLVVLVPVVKEGVKE